MIFDIFCRYQFVLESHAADIVSGSLAVLVQGLVPLGADSQAVRFFSLHRIVDLSLYMFLHWKEMIFLLLVLTVLYLCLCGFEQFD